MAIRPVDLQLSILQAPVIAAVAQQAETAPARALALAEQRFAAHLVEREETVEEVQPARRSRPVMRRRPQRRSTLARERLEAAVLGTLYSDDGEHLVDVTA